MSYLATERALMRREDPRLILPETQSIVVLGANYLPTTNPNSRPTPKIAAYALGDDYHDVLIQRMEALVRAIEILVGSSFSYRVYTDTGPILERELAQRAGLGWIGKNTCLIHPSLGSYFLLSEIFLAIPLQPDPPFTHDRCGSCARCIQACPTDCIRPDRTIDARRCISYLTIENKGPIPLELRREMDGWVFGCDVCQEVCPWNLRFASPSQDVAFDARPFLEEPSLMDFLQLDAETYREQLRRSPLRRAKLRGLHRNAAVAAGNARKEEDLPALAGLIHSPEPQTRAHAAWALGRLGNSQAKRLLLSARERERDQATQQEISLALRRLEDDSAS
jgi:epoxyqueuosine reductase